MNVFIYDQEPSYSSSRASTQRNLRWGRCYQQVSSRQSRVWKSVWSMKCDFYNDSRSTHPRVHVWEMMIRVRNHYQWLITIVHDEWNIELHRLLEEMRSRSSGEGWMTTLKSSCLSALLCFALSSLSLNQTSVYTASDKIRWKCDEKWLWQGGFI